MIDLDVTQETSRVTSPKEDKKVIVVVKEKISEVVESQAAPARRDVEVKSSPAPEADKKEAQSPEKKSTPVIKAYYTSGSNVKSFKKEVYQSPYQQAKLLPRKYDLTALKDPLLKLYRYQYLPGQVVVDSRVIAKSKGPA
jgi:hypothetical protein